MTIILEESGRLVIDIIDGSPEELRVRLMRSLARALSHYALNPDKRKTDHEDAAVLSDLLQELTNVKPVRRAMAYRR